MHLYSIGIMMPFAYIITLKDMSKVKYAFDWVDLRLSDFFFFYQIFLTRFLNRLLCP